MPLSNLVFTLLPIDLALGRLRWLHFNSNTSLRLARRLPPPGASTRNIHPYLATWTLATLLIYVFRLDSPSFLHPHFNITIDRETIRSQKERLALRRPGLLL